MSSNSPDNSTNVVLRMAGAADGAALRRLAGLDSSPLPRGRVLLGEVDGELRAAYSVDEGIAIADPFRSTLPLVEMLRGHATPDAGRRRGGERPATLGRRVPWAV